MELRRALKLLEGDLVWYGDTRCMKDHRRRAWGLVQRVTKAGGILVERLAPGAAVPPPIWLRPWNALPGPDEWVSYADVYDWQHREQAFA